MSGHDVFTKEDCKTVVEDVKKYRPDIVIMDNLIPDVGGVKATQLLKNEKDLQNIPVILFTASNNIRSLMEEARADGFVQKPFDIKTMQDIVDKYLTI